MKSIGWFGIGVVMLLATGALMVFNWPFGKYSKTTANPVPKVTIGVYYESLCPYSIDFIVSQVYPTWKKLHQYMNLTLVPFGKSNFQATPDGGWTFTCQHGPNECLGNILQSCALAHIPDQDTQISYISCLMASPYPPTYGPQCAKSVGIDFDTIKECSQGIEGEDLLHNNGLVTKALDPPLTFVPLVIFNGKFSQKDNDDATSDMAGVVCRYLKPSPAICSQFSR